MPGMGEEYHCQPSSLSLWRHQRDLCTTGRSRPFAAEQSRFCEPLRDPIGNIAARWLHIVGADMLYATFALGKDL